MTIIDKACWERGCPCYDDGEGAGVEVVRKEWVGLTNDEIAEIADISDCFEDVVEATEAKLNEKNT